VPRTRSEEIHPVLLVEDDELMRLSLEDRLRLEGYTVLSAATVDGARLMLTHGPRPSLVITDMRLPDGQGSQVFDFCRNQLPGVPVIVMTAFGSVADAVRLVKAGALDYVEKPFNLDAFIETIAMTVKTPEPRPERELRGSVEEAERTAIVEALERNDWAISKTAHVLGISRKNLWEKMRRYDIERR
jgi:DNA-binding NtrC family response regulator